MRLCGRTESAPGFRLAFLPRNLDSTDFSPEVRTIEWFPSTDTFSPEFCVTHRALGELDGVTRSQLFCPFPPQPQTVFSELCLPLEELVQLLSRYSRRFFLSNKKSFLFMSRWWHTSEHTIPFSSQQWLIILWRWLVTLLLFPGASKIGRLAGIYLASGSWLLWYAASCCLQKTETPKAFALTSRSCVSCTFSLEGKFIGVCSLLISIWLLGW